MQSDPAQLSDAQDLAPDLCIIGAGPAGIIIARELDRSGIRICLIESGGADVDQRVQRESRGESDGYPIHRLHRSRVRAFGGALRSPKVGDEGWAARPLDRIDFESRPGIPHTGWPFDREHLDPYYARAQAQSGLGAYEYEPGKWSDPSRTATLPLDGSEVETTMFQFGQPAFHHALGPLSASPDVRVLLRSRVIGLTVDERDRRIDGVVVRHTDGSRLVVRARVVVLAAGGIENVRLLLTADDLRGVGNEHDLVGRFFAERFSTHAGHIVAARPELVADTALYRVHNARGTSVCGALRVSDRIQRERQLLNSVFFILPRPAAVTTEAVRSLATLRKVSARRPLMDRSGLQMHLTRVVRGAGDIAQLGVGRFARAARPVMILRTQGEHAPNRDSRVTLGSRRDELGLPVARVTWRFHEDDRVSMRTSLEVIGAAMRASGLGLVQGALDDGDPPPLIEGNYHHLGTTRMHVDPRRGVVDANCRIHSVPNLYVAGSSVFPTYGSSNPTLTIVALALRLADHLRQQLTHG